MINVIDDNKDFNIILADNPLPIVLWGMGEWSKLLLQNTDLSVDDICDADSNKWGMEFDGYTILSPLDLERKYHDEIYVINTFGTTRSLQDGLYIMLSQYELKVNLVNFHSNIGFDLNCDEVMFENSHVEMISHIHNCGYKHERRSERAIEVAIAKRWISRYPDLIEIGAVTPYYLNDINYDVVDPAD